MRCITHKIVLSPEKRGFYAKVVFNFYFLILIWIIFKVFVEFVQYCLMFWLFGCKACGMLNPQARIEPIPPALDGEAFTTRLPGKSHKCDL